MSGWDAAKGLRLQTYHAVARTERGGPTCRCLEEEQWMSSLLTVLGFLTALEDLVL